MRLSSGVASRGGARRFRCADRAAVARWLQWPVAHGLADSACASGRIPVSWPDCPFLMPLVVAGDRRRPAASSTTADWALAGNTAAAQQESADRARAAPSGELLHRPP